jgi:hypothetical protein
MFGMSIMVYPALNNIANDTVYMLQRLAKFKFFTNVNPAGTRR